MAQNLETLKKIDNFDYIYVKNYKRQMRNVKLGSICVIYFPANIPNI